MSRVVVLHLPSRFFKEYSVYSTINGEVWRGEDSDEAYQQYHEQIAREATTLATMPVPEIWRNR